MDNCLPARAAKGRPDWPSGLVLQNCLTQPLRIELTDDSNWCEETNSFEIMNAQNSENFHSDLHVLYILLRSRYSVAKLVLTFTSITSDTQPFLMMGA